MLLGTRASNLLIDRPSLVSYCSEHFTDVQENYSSIEDPEATLSGMMLNHSFCLKRPCSSHPWAKQSANDRSFHFPSFNYSILWQWIVSCFAHWSYFHSHSSKELHSSGTLEKPFDRQKKIFAYPLVLIGTHMRLMIGGMKSWPKVAMSFFCLYKCMFSGFVLFLHNYLLYISISTPTF